MEVSAEQGTGVHGVGGISAAVLLWHKSFPIMQWLTSYEPWAGAGENRDNSVSVSEQVF